jgi:hypothetical protein
MDLGNVEVTSISRMYGVVRSIQVRALPDDTNYAGTKKITWLPKCAEEEAVPVECIEVAPLISVKSVAKEDGVEGLEAAASHPPRRKCVNEGTHSLLWLWLFVQAVPLPTRSRTRSYTRSSAHSSAHARTRTHTHTHTHTHPFPLAHTLARSHSLDGLQVTR